MDKHQIRTDLLKQAIALQIPVLQGEALQILSNQIKANHVSTFLEIGSANAKTAIELALDHPDLKIVTIERDPEMAALARENIARASLEERIRLIEADALDVNLNEMKADAIFIDGAKSKYNQFFQAYLPHLSPDGFFFIDNLDFHGLVDHPERTHNRHTKALIKKIREFRTFLQESEDLETEWIEAGDGIALTRRKHQCLVYY